MRIEQLHYFLDVAQTQSITRSAGNLFISPQGLSQAITALEKEYGMTFFERTKTGLVLNDKGAAFRHLAMELCEHFDRFETAAAELAGDAQDAGKEPFSLLLPPLVILGDAFGPMMDQLERAFPSVGFSVSEKNFDEVASRLDALVLRECCAALVNIPGFRRTELPPSDEVVVDEFLEMPIVAKVHRDSPLAGKKHLTKKELSTLPLVCFNEPIMESIIVHLVQEYGEPNIVMKGSTSRMLQLRKDAVAISVGMLKPSDETAVIPIVDSDSLSFAILHPRWASDRTAAVVAAVKRFLIDRYPQYKIEA